LALAVRLVNECSSKISVDIQCFSTICDKTQIHCNDTTTNETALDNFFEVKLDMDELCQFSNMLICPYVKEIIKNLITNLSQEVTSLKKNFNITNNVQHKWLDMVARRKDSEQKPPSTIPTVIIS
jgi:hypothetical protein